MKKIAITGGIGNGKSTVTRYLSQLGYLTTDADQLNRLALSEPETISRVTDAFGMDVLAPAGHIDRVKLREIVFKDPQKRSQLEKIMHPKIVAQFELMTAKIASVSANAWFFYEASLIFESGRQHEFDATIMVTCDAAIKTQRLIESRLMTPQQIAQVMDAQLSDQEKAKMATLTIDNSTNENDLLNKTMDLVTKLYLNFKEPK